MKKFWIFLTLPLLLIIWWGLDHHDSAPAIHFVVAKRATIESTVATNGKVEPAQWAASRAQTAGVVRTVLVQRGQIVSAGQTLIALDSASAQSDLAAARAKELEATQQSATLRGGGRQAAVLDLEDRIKTAQTALDVAQRTYESMRRLAAQQAATKLQVQQAKDAVDNAKLQLEALRNQRKTLVTASDENIAKARLQNAQADVALAEHRLGLTQIKAPVAGTIYQFDIKMGAYVQPGDLVALIGDLDRVKVQVYVDEPDLGRVAESEPVSITWDARPGQIWSGRVDKLPTEVIALAGTTRMVGEVGTVVDNPNHDLLPGVTVNATIISKVVKDALVVPKAALRSVRAVNGVYKLQDNTIVWVPVKTGISDVNNVQILSGVNQGDRLADRVIEPSDAEIRDGMRVKAVVD